MKEKKAIIIGGGVSGLSTAIYLRLNGYETLVLERNAVVGGACIGWERKDCYIDGCIHWLVGTNPRSKTYKLWETIGALSPEVGVFNQDDFHLIEFADGKKFTVWSDKKKLYDELVSFAPEDKKQIKKFISLIKRFERIDAPIEKPVDLMNIFDLLKIGLTMASDYYYVSKTSKISCEEYAQKFKNPYLRKWFAENMSSGYNLMSFLYMMAHITAGDGGIPLGGSKKMSERILERYLSLGGQIRVGAEVNEILVEDGVATGVTLKNGEKIFADWVISSVPVEQVLTKLLGGKYAVKKIDERLKDRKTYPIYTYTTAIFKVSADITNEPLSHKIYSSEPIELEKKHYAVTFRNYSYDSSLSKSGETIVQATLSGNDDTYFWWKEIKDKGEYRAKKQEIAQKMLAIYLKNYPFLEGKVEIIDVITPLTYQRYLLGRHGSFQGFVQTSKGKALMQKGEIDGLKNFILSGQWILRSGGLPPAVITGKFSAQRICVRDGKKFCSN